MRRFDLNVKFDYLRPDQAWQMFQAHGDAMLIVPPPDTQISVRGLLNLTPGDFASALRQSRFRPIETAQALFDVIVCVCAMKGGLRKAIGFA